MERRSGRPEGASAMVTSVEAMAKGRSYVRCSICLISSTEVQTE